MPVAAAFGAAGSIGSSLIGGLSASKAAKQQHEAALTAADSMNKSLASANQQLTTANDRAHSTISDEQASLTPFEAAGAQGLKNLTSTSPFSFTASDFQSSPGYQFALDQDQNAIQHSAAATGGLMSGDTLEALSKYTVGMADQDYNNAYNRALQTYNTNYNNNLSLAGIGLEANSRYLGTDNSLLAADQAFGTGESNNLMTAAQSIGQDLTGAGNAQAAGTVGAGNAFAGGISGAANSISSALLLQQLLGKQQSVNNTPSYSGTTSAWAAPTTSGSYGTAPWVDTSNMYSDALGGLVGGSNS